MPASRLWEAYLGEIRFEFLKALRTPAFAVPTLLFPLMFYLLFGVALGSMRGNSMQSIYTFAAYGAFGAMGPGLFGFGVALAIEREQGLLTLKQALPSPPGVYLLARAAMSMLFVAVITLLLMICAVTLGKVPLTAGQAVLLFAVNVLGTLPFCAIGLFVGATVSGQASPAIVNLIFLPMAFLSGLFLPLPVMPKVLIDIAPVWPAYHLAQLALGAVGAPARGSAGGHVAVLAAFTLVFFALAVHRMHGRGLRMAGSRGLALKTGVAIAAAALVAVGLSSMAGGRSAESNAASAATSSPSQSPASTAANGPPGAPAPADPTIADFDSGSAAARYGVGWQAAADRENGGQSHATATVVKGGAQGTSGALEIAGDIRGGVDQPYAGAMFFPVGPPWSGTMDYSGRSTLRFHARGDGKTYVVTLFTGPELSYQPAILMFDASPEWREMRFSLADSGVDLRHVRAIGIMGGIPGEFRLQIDSVRIE
jgi:ABC-2 type transport system permease protein